MVHLLVFCREQDMGITRKEGRVLAFQALCAWQAGCALQDVFSFLWIDDKHRENDSELFFPTLLVRGTIEHVEEIDSIIKSKLKNWDFSRVSPLDKANLRLGTYSLLYQKDVEPLIIISEAIRIAEDFCSEDSYKFINGILDSIRLSLKDINIL